MAYHMFTARIRAVGPLSRCRYGANIGAAGVTLRNSYGVLTRQVRSLIQSGQASANANPAHSKVLCKPGGGLLEIGVRKFSTTTAAAQWFLGPNKGWTNRSKYGSVYGIALGALGVTTVVVWLHTGAHLAMAGSDTVNLDSAKGDWKQVKDKLLSMENRKEYYRTTPLFLDKVPVWTSTPVKKPKFKRNEALDQKISLFRGDITKLEIDAIVNAANKSLQGGGGVDGAIHRTAGPLLKAECAELQGCETGEAKITGGYGLPAKYVIHTVGPIVLGEVGEEERDRLRDCYHHCLEKASENNLRTVAFPCISTGVYGYPPNLAVHVALETVRKYLDEHHNKLDRVIFCVFLPTDEELYLKNLPLYFPPDLPEKSKL